MDYQKHYDRLISRARNRIIEGYVEKHHILPRCMGGPNDSFNLVELTPEEHYVAHLLLSRIHPNNRKLLCAAHYMSSRPGNKTHGWLRRLFSKSQSISQTGKKNTQYGTRWIHHLGLKENDKIPATDPTPVGWLDGRKLKFDRDCRVCGKSFPVSGKKSFCSDTCKKHAKAPSNKIIDDNFEAMVEFFKVCHSVDRTLKHFGVEGVRAGNTYLSSRLKALGLRVRPSNR